MLVGFLICGSGKSINIACVYSYTEKWDFIVNINFSCDFKNGDILKNLLYDVTFISAIFEKE